MKTKKIIIANTIAVLIIPSITYAATGIGKQTDIDNCANLFSGEAHCATWNASTSGVCGCQTCIAAYPSSTSVTPINKTINGKTYTLMDGCHCGSCTCRTNPDTSKPYGRCSCIGGAAYYGECTATKEYETCTRENCTKGWPITLNGVFYCGKNTDSSCTANVKGARTAVWASTKCSDGAGVTDEKCVVAACSSGVISSDKSSCVCNTGTWGNDPTQCQNCPGNGTSDINFHPTLGPHQIVACYIPADTEFSDSTGTGVYKEDCHYSN